jgi:tetratricopeptide (TPR) repeat protein
LTAFTLALIGTGGASDATAEADASMKDCVQAIRTELKHAETYYWFGMAEQGNLDAFRNGLSHLDRAELLIEQGSLSDDEASQFQARVDGLRTDLDEQIEIAHDTLYGLFPLTRFLRRSIFSDSISLHTFELIDDPTVMASTFAAKNLALETIKQWTQRHQLDVVFTSVPHNPQLENEALYVFNSHPKYFVHNLREVTDALDDAQLKDFQAGRVTPGIRRSLLSAFGVNDLLVVLVRETDVTDGNYFYILEGKIYRSQQDDPTHSFAVMGFSRDRNAMMVPIIVTNMLLLGLAYAAFWLESRIRKRAVVRASTATILVLPLAAFTVGRCTPWFLAPLLSSIAPIPETLAIVSFWLPCVAGTALIVVPMIGFRLVSNRLARFWPMFGTSGRLVAVFTGIGAGAAAYFSVPLFLYLEGFAPVVLLPLTLAVVGLAYLLGRALDGVDRLSTAVAYATVLLSLPLGAAIFHGLALWVWCGAALIVGVCLLPAAFDLRSRAAAADMAEGAIARTSDRESERTEVPVPVDGRLGERIEEPRYQQFPVHERLWQLVEPACHGRTAHLAVHGLGGCGLSATAENLVDRLRDASAAGGRKPVVMCGECSHSVGEPTPYGPFQKALAQHFEIELLTAPESKLTEIDAALGDVFQSVVPFAGILFPATEGSAAGATSPEQVVASIAWMLRRMSKTRMVVLLIDDVQWLDEASKALLRHLVSEFPAGGAESIALIVTSHDRECLDGLGFDESSQAELPPPTHEQQVQILTGGIGLAEATAEQIVSRLGSSTSSQGGLFWLLQVVANLDRAGVFTPTEEGLALRDGKWPDDIVIPEAMRDVLCEQLRQCPEYRSVIECAACACEAREFSALLVAEALEMPRLKLLAELDRMDRETSILYDVRNRDDTFAFQSSFMLDVVRDELRILERGPSSADVPQIIREYHARLGTSLEKTLQANSNRIYAVANHFYAAGTPFADRGMKYCLDAAHASAAVLDFDAAENYLRRAEECAQWIGELARVEAERLDIECREAHLSGHGEDHVRLAQAGDAYLRGHPDCPTGLQLSIAQAHYDAGKSTGDRAWFSRSLEIGRKIIDEAKSVRDEATGRHFVGISLPRDQRDKRRRQLREALRLMEAESSSREDRALLGRIMGSLAEELSHGSAKDRREAKRLFERRLKLNETHQVGDPRGQAMTHGGLGRLAFFHEPKDIATAVRHFERDLEISEAIGDRVGQVQMHSLLGACALEEDDIERATDHYQRSWQLAKYPINQFFAGVGLISCHARRMQTDEFHKVVRRLLEIAQDGVPQSCAEDLVAALASCPPDVLDARSQELREIAQAAMALEPQCGSR